MDSITGSELVKTPCTLNISADRDDPTRVVTTRHSEIDPWQFANDDSTVRDLFCCRTTKRYTAANSVIKPKRIKYMCIYLVLKECSRKHSFCDSTVRDLFCCRTTKRYTAANSVIKPKRIKYMCIYLVLKECSRKHSFWCTIKRSYRTTTHETNNLNT